MSNRLRNFRNTSARCWVWQLWHGTRLLEEGREPSRALALVILRQRVRQRGIPSAKLSARLIYFMPGGTARELVPIATLLARSPRAEA